MPLEMERPSSSYIVDVCSSNKQMHNDGIVSRFISDAPFDQLDAPSGCEAP